MRHVIPSGNWLQSMADAIDIAEDGDVIVVLSKEAMEQGIDYHFQKHPGKDLFYEVDSPASAEFWPAQP